MRNGVHHRRTTCRACGGTAVTRFLELGPTPLANAFLTSPDDFTRERAFPLDVYFCGTCSLVQLMDVIDPEVLFRHYLYVTGTSETVAIHNRGYAKAVVERLGLGSSDLVVEVASNDGSLLRQFQTHGVRVLGVEPATNIAETARAAGVETRNEFFSADYARRLRRECGAARAVIGNNVLAHVDDTLDFLTGCRELVADDGLVVVEVPYLGDLLERLEYDTIYHEHLCYFAVRPLMRLAERADLMLDRVDHLPLHGGSLRVWARPAMNGPGHSPEVEAWAEREGEAAFDRLDRYHGFAEGVAANRTALLEMLTSLHKDGRTIGGYGAPAKGNTLLNFCRIGPEILPFTVDQNALKVGRYTPGMHIPVLPVDAIGERRPDYLFILAWNFADEIMRQQRAFHEAGGRFIIPIPEPHVVAR